jgi:hypothetical protein
MKFFPGLAVSAALVFAASAANAQMSAPYVAGNARPASDVDGPYGGGPPEEVPPPAPRYRYSYGPDRGGYAPDRGYGVPDRGYAPEYRYGPERGYGPDRGGYGPDYGYAPGPALLSPQEVYAILRENGFSPLGVPRQRGYVYVIAVLDRGGEDGRLTIDGRSGRIIRFVPASQWGGSYGGRSYGGGSYGGGAYDRMNFGHGANIAPPAGSAGALPPMTRINAAPPPPPASVPSVATRAAVPVPTLRPAVAATKPAQPVQRSAVNEAKPTAAPPQTSGTVGEAKPSVPAIKPSQGMPPVQGLE